MVIALADIYESEIQDLVWDNPEEILGETRFLIRRQPTLALGGKPDILALDRDALVVVIEVLRDFDRGQLPSVSNTLGGRGFPMPSRLVA